MQKTPARPGWERARSSSALEETRSHRDRGKQKPGSKPGKKGDGRAGGHTQDAAQCRRDLQRAEVLISRLRTQVAELQCELRIREIIGAAGAKLQEMQQKHAADLASTKGQLDELTAQVTISNCKVHALQSQAGQAAVASHNQMVAQLQEHKKLMEQQTQLYQAQEVKLTQRMAAYVAENVETKKRLDNLNDQLILASMEKQAMSKQKDRAFVYSHLAVALHVCVLAQDEMAVKLSELENKIHELSDEKEPKVILHFPCFACHALARISTSGSRPKWRSR